MVIFAFGFRGSDQRQLRRLLAKVASNETEGFAACVFPVGYMYAGRGIQDICLGERGHGNRPGRKSVTDS